MSPRGAATVTVPAPVFGHPGPNDTPASTCRRAAKNLRTGFPVGGSNTAQGVALLLDHVADALDEQAATKPAPAASHHTSEGLTPDEQAAVTRAGELWNLLCRIVGDGRTRDPDLTELCAHVHAIQHTVMAQAAARAHPDQFRLLGGSVGDLASGAPL